MIQGEWPITASMIGAVLAIITAVFTSFRYFTGAVENAEKASLAAIDSLRKEMQLLVDRYGETGSKERSIMGATLGSAIADVRTDVERLKRETVRREDMSALEQRLNSLFQKLETKVEKVGDAVAGLGNVEAQLTRMEQLINRPYKDQSPNAPR